MAIILEEQTAVDITIASLGIVIPASSTDVDLTDQYPVLLLTFYGIPEIRTNVVNDIFLINNGTLSLDKTASLAFLDEFLRQELSAAVGELGEILKDGSVPFEGDQSMGGNKLTDVATGTGPLHGINFSQMGVAADTAKFLEVSWVDAGSAGLSIIGASYTCYAVLRYRGSDDIGDPQAITLVSTVNTSIKTMDIRIVDVTNGGLVIAEKLGISQTTLGTPAGIDMGAISNIPAASSVMEVQAKMNGGGTGILYTLSWEFI